MADNHEGMWDRFCWFGFRAVRKATSGGINVLKALPETSVGGPDRIISDMEALLIKSMGLSNIANMSFQAADEWRQVELDQIDRYLGKVTGDP